MANEKHTQHALTDLQAMLSDPHIIAMLAKPETSARRLPRAMRKDGINTLGALMEHCSQILKRKMLRLHRIDQDPSVCSCCGKEEQMYFDADVYADDEPYAAFAFGGEHCGQPACILVYLPDEVDVHRNPHVAFKLNLRVDAGKYLYSFAVDEEHLEHDDDCPPVRCLSRAEALAHARKQEVFDVVDYVVGTEEFQRFLARPVASLNDHA